MRLIDANALRGIESLLNTDIIQASKEASWLMSQVLHDIDAMSAIDPETLPVVQQLRAELWKAKAERDAAVKSRAKLAEYELTVCEEFCYGDAQHDIPPCEWLIDGKCTLREWVKTND